MIHYHGTPIGGSRQDTARFLMGRHCLIPFAYQSDVGAAAEVAQSFVFDNSAFTAWKGGAPVDAEGYTRWCDQWKRHPGLDWCLIPDVIDGNEAENDAMIRAWPSNIRGVPVWHLHEDLARLDRLAGQWPTVALGSSGQWRTPGAVGWWARMAEAMAVVCDDQGRPKTRLHGLRMLDPRIFTRLPLASADSTNAAVNSGSLSRFGTYQPPTRSQRAAVIAERIEAHNSASVWCPSTQEEMMFA